MNVSLPSDRSEQASQPDADRRTPGALLLSAVLITVTLMTFTGIVFPLAMMGIGRVLFPDQSSGSLVRGANGHVIGSRLIGQSFTLPGYFHPRPSAAGTAYDAGSSGGTNLGPTNAYLIKKTVAQANRVRTEDLLPARYPLPADAVSTSASGLDPDISPAYAALQVRRVARARGLSQTIVRALVRRYTSGRDLGLFGEPRVNVLALNMALDRLKT